ncbi:DUF6886 family protein [Catenuloplanes sp. NPDC051500]|uniref:DUF6886 family protein n=1 Tax=Catenuloplanes sp. NPDC051500 TaxID=3363959 RepID=UPI003789D03F
MPRLFHVSDEGPFTTMSPRPSPPGTPHEGREWVWAVDEQHLPNYLLPRDCPRVCWVAPQAPHVLLSSPAARVIAVEHSWLPRLLPAGLNVHYLDPAHFTLLDPAAGYWVSDQTAAVLQVHHVDDCLTALVRQNVEVRLTTSLWPYVDAVVAAGGEFSAIRMRNALPRQAADDAVTSPSASAATPRG